MPALPPAPDVGPPGHDVLFARGWLLYHQYRRAELRPDLTTADFRFLGTSGVVPVVTTTAGRAVRLWGLAEQAANALTPTLDTLTAWLADCGAPDGNRPERRAAG